jgi:hypothetical protein
VRTVEIFPSNLLTVPDPSQPTGLRVDLPKPNCTVYVSDCSNIDVINTLDGFSLLPRVSIRFDGPVDLATVSSASVHLYDLSCLACVPIGIERPIWEQAATTLHFEPASSLMEATTYAIVVTTDVRDGEGKPLARTGASALGRYAATLRGILGRAAAVSVFTTHTPTYDLAAIRDQLDAAIPAPASILASFPRAGTTIVFNRQNVGPPGGFTVIPVLTPALEFFPGSVESIVFGSYSSPQYLTAQGVLASPPAPQTLETIQFSLFLPSTPEPPDGYPVAIYAHGGGLPGKNGPAYANGSTLAAHGIATIAISAVGAAGGPGGTLTVTTPSGTTTLPGGGREGLSAVSPVPIIGGTDQTRQTVIDWMQLVRVIGSGGVPHLSRSRIYFYGQSGGAFSGAILLGTDPKIRAGVLNVVAGEGIEAARYSHMLRPTIGRSAAAAIPSLYNADPFAPGFAPFTSFVENIPFRGEPILVDAVPGASALQQSLFRYMWVRQTANPSGYAHLLKRPLIVQFAKGDKLVPNPSTSILLRAGNLEHRATYFRNDLAWAANPVYQKDPHTFANQVHMPGAPADTARQAQVQIATFFASDGATTIDPDGDAPLFETPIAGPLPEDLSFIP